VGTAAFGVAHTPVRTTARLLGLVMRSPPISDAPGPPTRVLRGGCDVCPRLDSTHAAAAPGWHAG